VQLLTDNGPTTSNAASVDRCDNPSGVCQCGCGKRTSLSVTTDGNKGYVRGCPRRYVNGHNGARNPPQFVIDQGGCWIWQRTRSKAGYGRVRDGVRMRFAHVVWYERTVGPVPHGKVLHHRCGRGHLGCMNPYHMQPVSPAENAQLSRAAKLDWGQVDTLRRKFSAGNVTKTSLGREFGISDAQVHNIVTGKSWAA
jgi:hypothetical protein